MQIITRQKISVHRISQIGASDKYAPAREYKRDSYAKARNFVWLWMKNALVLEHRATPLCRIFSSPFVISTTRKNAPQDCRVKTNGAKNGELKYLSWMRAKLKFRWKLV